ncbi:LytR/AlgR family response regulator transcription factor [Hymenobacter siberiensis]|jgi:DNA-binding LytR/AlgR family response regulator|uniref:LytR/AlgR family response regulator transcription factor n=1 Tax=Hymenobacter siberiensis TaxID=2848396 RepID=UPI001C1E85F7|nr:LytTR family DNA-binding domain-containing protein [Hymenobacter siberiensis]MBU6120251.1 LytTR family DNA-binding domain-containing protein [Hymenobacter siberiensis]
MLSCLIIDDEQGAIDILSTFIEKTPFLNLEGTTSSPIEALSIIENQTIDLVFLDIHMPQISGLDFMPLIKGRTKVILTTAYSEFAVKGFELEALDYLLKPIAFERFLKAAQKALNANIEPSARWQPAEKEDDYIFVKTESKGKMMKVNFADIMYIEGMKNYLSINTKEDQVVTLLNIKDLEERLPARQFMRVHKSYIVSINKIKAIDGNQILFTDMKAYVPLGDTYRSAFFEALNQKMMGGKK